MGVVTQAFGLRHIFQHLPGCAGAWLEEVEDRRLKIKCGRRKASKAHRLTNVINITAMKTPRCAVTGLSTDKELYGVNGFSVLNILSAGCLMTTHHVVRS